MKNIAITFFDALAKNYQSYCAYHKRQFKYVGIVGAIGFPLFYYIYTNIVVQPYENLPIRIIATFLCILLALQEYWPEKFKRYYVGYSYATILYILPFFHVFMSLKNNGNIVFISDSLMAVFFLVLLTDWRNTIAMIFVGTVLGTLLYVMTTDNPTLPIDYVSRLPTFILIVVGGSLFKFSEKQLQSAKNNALTALAGTIAHEMRNPLGQMKLALDEISRLLPTPNTSNTDYAIPAKTVNDVYANIAQGLISCNRGLQVIDTTLHQVSAQELNATSFEYLSAATTTQNAIEEYSFESKDERNRISVHNLNDFTFKVDETTYIYVIFNLIKNALYYFKSYPNANITIAIDFQKITITDTGPGIPEHIRSKLFLDFATADKTNGTGLGLGYCYRAMHAFGGKISCESVVNQYTTFTLTFPVITQAEIIAHAKSVLQRAIPLFKHKRILVVDDQIVYHASVRHLLDELGCDVDGAESGQVAIDMLQEKSYDLIIMDLVMPNKDGYMTTEEIRLGVVPGQKNIPILAHSSEPSYMARIKTQKVGMDGFVGKPCDQLELLKAILQAFEFAKKRNSFEETESYFAGKTILIADDELANRQYLEIYANEWGMNTLHAENGQAVLDILEKESQVDFIFMDMRMPVVSGIEATRRIRSNPAFQHLIIIALTGNSSEQAKQEAKESGMNDFITKPFDKIVLQQKLAHLIKENRSMQGQFSPIAATIATRAITHQPSYAEKVYSYITDALNPPNQEQRPIKGVSENDLHSNRYTPIYASQTTFFKDLPLIDHERLTTSQTNFKDKFQELLQRFINNLIRRDNELQIGVSNNDQAAILNALHSFLGVAGYVGAHALHQYVKQRLYPAVYAGHMPDEEAWVETVHALVQISVDALQRDWVYE